MFKSNLQQVVEVHKCDLDGLRKLVQDLQDMVFQQQKIIGEQGQILEKFSQSYVQLQADVQNMEASLLDSLQDQAKTTEVYSKTDVDDMLIRMADSIIMEMNIRASSYCSKDAMEMALRNKVDSSDLSDFMAWESFVRTVDQFESSDESMISWSS